VAIVLALVMPSVRAPAWAQTGLAPTTGWYITPSLRLSESFDSNIFASSSGQQSDFITRISPGLEGGYHTAPFTLTASGGFESDIFAKNPQLDDATMGWHAGLNGEYLPVRSLTLGLNVNYTETKSLPTLTQGLVTLNVLNPLNPANTVQFGIQRATLLSALSSAAYQFTPSTAGTSAFSYTHSTLQGGATNSVYATQLGLSHRFTSVDTGTLTYLISVFESPGFPTEVVNTPMIGWIRQFTSNTTLTFSGGPSFAEGSVFPAVNAQLTHQFKVFDTVASVLLGYTYSQGIVIGQAGLENTQTGVASISLEPIRALKVGLGVTAARYESPTGTTNPTITTYGVGIGATYQILRWLSVGARYTFTYQEQSGGNIPRSVVSVALDVTYPVRADQ